MAHESSILAGQGSDTGTFDRAIHHCSGCGQRIGPSLPPPAGSGYADTEGNPLTSGVQFLQKPFNHATLLDAVKNVMASKRSAPSDGTDAATAT